MSKSCTPHFNELLGARGGKTPTEGDSHPGFKGGSDKGEPTYVDQPMTHAGAAKPGSGKK